MRIKLVNCALSHKNAGRITTAHAPLFPGYIFVSLDPSCDRWRSVNGTIGVLRIVAFGSTPAPVPEGVIEALIANCDDDGILSFEQSLEIGQTVRILAGPFSELVGTLEHLDANGRVRVMLEIMHRRVSLALPLGVVGT